LSRQRPRTVFDAGTMHSIVYVVILTRRGLERFDCSLTLRDARVKRVRSNRIVASALDLYLQDEKDGLCTVEFLPTDDPFGRIDTRISKLQPRL
jgi:hypothetical protein